MKISEKQIRNLVREEILREHKKSLAEDREARRERRLSRRLRRAQKMADKAGNSEVSSELDDLIAMAGDPGEEEEEGPQSARADAEPSSTSAEQPASLSDEEISLPNDRYTYIYDLAASNATVGSGRGGGEVKLHFTVAGGPQNVGKTFPLTPGHPLEAELKKQDRVMQDLERAETPERVAVADTSDDDDVSEVQMESRKILKRSQLRKMLQREAYRALTR